MADERASAGALTMANPCQRTLKGQAFAQALASAFCARARRALSRFLGRSEWTRRMSAAKSDCSRSISALAPERLSATGHQLHSPLWLLRSSADTSVDCEQPRSPNVTPPPGARIHHSPFISFTRAPPAKSPPAAPGQFSTPARVCLRSQGVQQLSAPLELSLAQCAQLTHHHLLQRCDTHPPQR